MSCKLNKYYEYYILIYNNKKKKLDVIPAENVTCCAVKIVVFVEYTRGGGECFKSGLKYPNKKWYWNVDRGFIVEGYARWISLTSRGCCAWKHDYVLSSWKISRSRYGEGRGNLFISPRLRLNRFRVY